MSPQIVRLMPDIMYSVLRYYRTFEYTVGSVTGKLEVHHVGLKFRAGYPDDLTKVTAPTLALCGPEDFQQTEEFFGEDAAEHTLSLMTYGFVTGVGDDDAHRRYRDRLLSDLVLLLSGPAGSEGIDLYDHASKTLIGSIDTSRVRGRLLPVNAIEIPADRHKFVVAMDVHYA